VTLVVNLDHLVHALEVEDDSTAHVRRRAAVTQVLTGGDGVHGYLVLVGGTNDSLHFLNGGRRNGSGGNRLIWLVPEYRIGITVQVDILFAGKYPFIADSLPELGECGFKVFRTHALGKNHDCFLLINLECIYATVKTDRGAITHEERGTSGTAADRSVSVTLDEAATRAGHSVSTAAIQLP